MYIVLGGWLRIEEMNICLHSPIISIDTHLFKEAECAELLSIVSLLLIIKRATIVQNTYYAKRPATTNAGIFFPVIIDVRSEYEYQAGHIHRLPYIFHFGKHLTRNTFKATRPPSHSCCIVSTAHARHCQMGTIDAGI